MKFLIIACVILGYTFKGNEDVVVYHIKQSAIQIYEHVKSGGGDYKPSENNIQLDNSIDNRSTKNGKKSQNHDSSNVYEEELEGEVEYIEQGQRDDEGMLNTMYDASITTISVVSYILRNVGDRHPNDPIRK